MAAEAEEPSNIDLYGLIQGGMKDFISGAVVHRLEPYVFTKDETFTM